MPRSPASLEQLFDRTWWPGHPFRPRLSPLRRYGMFALLCVLATVIGAYAYLTQSGRVKGMCEEYLSQLLGGRVHVERASLSIFEGLQLDHVTVQVDADARDGARADDSTLFQVSHVALKYHPESILNGHLEATEIVAIDPVVTLCENLDSTDPAHRWNYQRMRLRPRPSTTQPQQRRPMVLPQVKLRNGLVRYSQMQRGRVRDVGTMAIDGSVGPADQPGHYLFRVQSLGGSDVLGPVVTGDVATGTGQVEARLANFAFGPDIMAILPDVARQWCAEHQLAGRVDIPKFVYTPAPPNAPPGAKPQFEVEMRMDGVQLAVDPNDWFSRIEQEQVTSLRGGFDLMRLAGLNGQVRRAAGPEGFVDALESTVMPAKILLEDARGTFVFTQDSITLRGLMGSVESNDFHIDGVIGGYSPSAPATLTIRGQGLKVPKFPRFVNSMPRIVRDIYQGLKPEGACDLYVKIDRPTPGAKPLAEGQVDFLTGSFQVDAFPYPLRNVTGQITFGPDPVFGTRLDIRNVRGYGSEGGPNADKFLVVNGSVAPLSGDGEVNVTITGEHISSEPPIHSAMPKEVKDAVATLDPSHTGAFPTFKANVSGKVHRDPGPYKPFTLVLTMDLEDAAGTFEGFPYPLENIVGRLVVGPTFAHLDHMTAHKGDATVTLDGELTWGPGKPPTPNLTITARNAPIDATLLNAIPAAERVWLKRLGVGGKLDVLDGHVTRKSASTQPSDIDVALDMAIHDGTLWPDGGTYDVSDVAGRIHLADGRLALNDFTARRKGAEFTAKGMASWDVDHPELAIWATAKDLLLEPALYQMLPKPAKAAWDSVQPEGTVDLSLTYGDPALAATQPASATEPTTQPASPLYALTLTPRKLAVTLRALPYKLTDVTGTVTVTPAKAELTNVIAKHGKATLAISGSCPQGKDAAWTLAVMGRDLPTDAELHRALPTGLTSLLDAMKIRGSLSFDFPKLTYQTNDDPIATTTTAAAAPTTRGVPAMADLDLAGTVWLMNGSMEAGVPVTDLSAVVKLDTAFRKGKLGRLRGSVQAPSLKVAGRPVTDFYAELFKPETQDLVRLEKVQAQLAGGELAGQMDVAFPDVGPSRYALGLILRNADVPQLTGDKDQSVKGQLTASLALEGAWNDPASRRGRGDVSVTGRDMYRVPLVLGLLQITNLSLPISSPFNEANARFGLEGPKVTFESIELRASNMIMQGSGSLNFDTKRVKLTFTTDNPNWPKLPVLSDLITGAKHELMQIHVTGTVQEPKVTGAMMNTLTTTIDEVLKGNDARNTDNDTSTPAPRRKR